MNAVFVDWIGIEIQTEITLLKGVSPKTEKMVSLVVLSPIGTNNFQVLYIHKHCGVVVVVEYYLVG